MGRVAGAFVASWAFMLGGCLATPPRSCAEGCLSGTSCNLRWLLCYPDDDASDAGADAGQGDLDGGDAGGDAGESSDCQPGVIPLPRFGVTATHGYDGYDGVYFVGGIDPCGGYSARIEKYQYGSPHWTRETDLPEGRAFAAATDGHVTADDDTVYSLGGATAQADGGPVTETLALNANAPGSGWQGRGVLPLALDWAAAAAGKYVLGGFDATLAPRGETYLGGASLVSWSSAPTLSHPRGGLGADVSGSVLFAIGGWEDGAGELLPSAATEQLAGNAWTDLPPLPTARGGLAVACDIHNHVWAIGGNTAPFGETPVPTDEIDVFDTDAGTWTVLDAGLPMARWGLAAGYNQDDANGSAALVDKIYVFGGQLPDGGLSAELDELDPVAFTVRSL